MVKNSLCSLTSHWQKSTIFPYNVSYIEKEIKLKNHQKLLFVPLTCHGQKSSWKTFFHTLICFKLKINWQMHLTWRLLWPQLTQAAEQQLEGKNLIQYTLSKSVQGSLLTEYSTIFHYLIFTYLSFFLTTTITLFFYCTQICRSSTTHFFIFDGVLPFEFSFSLNFWYFQFLPCAKYRLPQH